MNKIDVRGKNIEVTQALRENAENRMTRVLAQFAQEGKAIVRLAVEREQMIAEGTLTIGGLILRAEERNSDMYSAIDLVGDKLERQIRKYKTRLDKRIRMKQIETEQIKHGSEPAMKEEKFDVVRRKQVLLTPMSLDEAILQMNLLQHDFFAYLDADMDAVNVIYRRKNSGYGLLELEK